MTEDFLNDKIPHRDSLILTLCQAIETKECRGERQRIFYCKLRTLTP